MQLSFDDTGRDERPAVRPLAEGAVVLAGFATGVAPSLLEAIANISRDAPFRRMMTRGGKLMSAAMTNCGSAGWVTDRHGYRYEALDPERCEPWPVMPSAFAALAAGAASAAGFADFAPDACLINRYSPGARMTLHQDRDERDFDAPIVSVSLGLPVTFLFGGSTRSERPARVELRHGDVAVWGGAARLRFHGVLPLAAGVHPLAGGARFNLTLRKAR